MVHAGCTHAGRWVELEAEPSARSPGALRPIAVFEFWEKPDANGFVRANRALGRDPADGRWQDDVAAWDYLPPVDTLPWRRDEVRASVTGRPLSEEVNAASYCHKLLSTAVAVDFYTSSTNAECHTLSQTAPIAELVYPKSEHIVLASECLATYWC